MHAGTYAWLSSTAAGTHGESTSCSLPLFIGRKVKVNAYALNDLTQEVIVGEKKFMNLCEGTLPVKSIKKDTVGIRFLCSNFVHNVCTYLCVVFFA